jgi:hypothetical protein
MSFNIKMLRSEFKKGNQFKNSPVVRTNCRNVSSATSLSSRRQSRLFGTKRTSRSRLEAFRRDIPDERSRRSRQLQAEVAADSGFGSSLPQQHFAS